MVIPLKPGYVPHWAFRLKYCPDMGVDSVNHMLKLMSIHYE